LGNEAVITNGKGNTYGFEVFAQKKLTDQFFGLLSYTFYRSKYSGANNVLIPSSWDNEQLLSVTLGYKFQRNWELGLKFRYQGGAPYTPYNESESRINYLSQGQGIFDFTKLNTLRLGGYNGSDIRIDKKWNFKKTTIDLFLDEFMMELIKVSNRETEAEIDYEVLEVRFKHAVYKITANGLYLKEKFNGVRLVKDL
jgi:hypothetical protein